jgi:hypothetical protein
VALVDAGQLDIDVVAVGVALLTRERQIEEGGGEREPVCRGQAQERKRAPAKGPLVSEGRAASDCRWPVGP